MKKKLLVEGMMCGNCERHVTEALNELNGVSNVQVKLDTKEVFIDAEDSVSDEAIREAIDEVGYDVKEIAVI